MNKFSTVDDTFSEVLSHVATDTLDPSDENAMQGDLKRQKEQKEISHHIRKDVINLTEAYKSTFSSGSSSSASHGHGQSSYPQVAHFTPLSAKSLMPKVQYCYIVSQTSHRRWYAKYPDCCPGSTQGSTSTRKEDECIRHCSVGLGKALPGHWGEVPY